MIDHACLLTAEAACLGGLHQQLRRHGSLTLQPNSCWQMGVHALYTASSSLPSSRPTAAQNPCVGACLSSCCCHTAMHHQEEDAAAQRRGPTHLVIEQEGGCLGQVIPGGGGLLMGGTEADCDCPRRPEDAPCASAHTSRVRNWCHVSAACSTLPWKVTNQRPLRSKGWGTLGKAAASTPALMALLRSKASGFCAYPKDHAAAMQTWSAHAEWMAGSMHCGCGGNRVTCYKRASIQELHTIWHVEYTTLQAQRYYVTILSLQILPCAYLHQLVDVHICSRQSGCLLLEQLLCTPWLVAGASAPRVPGLVLLTSSARLCSSAAHQEQPWANTRVCSLCHSTQPGT